MIIKRSQLHQLCLIGLDIETFNIGSIDRTIQKIVYFINMETRCLTFMILRDRVFTHLETNVNKVIHVEN